MGFDRITPFEAWFHGPASERTVKASASRKIVWTPEMDRVLILASRSMTPLGWKEIAKHLKLGICVVRERYYVGLKLPPKERMPRTTPIYNKIVWTEDMDKILIDASKNPNPPTWEQLDRQIGVSISRIQMRYYKELKLPPKVRVNCLPRKSKTPAG